MTEKETPDSGPVTLLKDLDWSAVDACDVRQAAVFFGQPAGSGLVLNMGLPIYPISNTGEGSDPSEVRVQPAARVFLGPSELQNLRDLLIKWAPAIGDEEPAATDDST